MVVELQADHVHSKAVPDLIAKLLAERQVMLVSFNRVAGLKATSRPPLVRQLLRKFCQILVDYAALGHFEVYQGIEEQSELTENRQIKCLARQLYPLIARTTLSVLAFNDHYGSDQGRRSLSALGAELSRLGEELAERLELEDRLIAVARALPKGSIH